MRIEDHWKEGTEFYVRFETKTHRLISKNIILPSDTTLKQAEYIVLSSFNNIKRIVNLYERESALICIGV